MDNLVTMHLLCKCFLNTKKFDTEKGQMLEEIYLLFIHYKSDFHHVKFFSTDYCLEMYTK